MGEFAIGQSVWRREDPRLLRGNGRYFDDLNLADQLFAAHRALAAIPPWSTSERCAASTLRLRCMWRYPAC
jgi:CO/xanthine dehydrogenase Mo-binding subunit